MICGIGNIVILKGAFADPGTGDSVDPGNVICTVRDPSGTESTPEVAGSNGVYVAEIEADQAGIWRYAFDGTGEHQASGEGQFSVSRRSVPRD